MKLAMMLDIMLMILIIMMGLCIIIYQIFLQIELSQTLHILYKMFNIFLIIH